MGPKRRAEHTTQKNALEGWLLPALACMQQKNMRKNRPFSVVARNAELLGTARCIRWFGRHSDVPPIAPPIPPRLGGQRAVVVVTVVARRPGNACDNSKGVCNLSAGSCAVTVRVGSIVFGAAAAPAPIANCETVNKCEGARPERVSYPRLASMLASRKSTGLRKNSARFASLIEPAFISSTGARISAARHAGEIACN